MALTCHCQMAALGVADSWHPRHPPLILSLGVSTYREWIAKTPWWELFGSVLHKDWGGPVLPGLLSGDQVGQPSLRKWPRRLRRGSVTVGIPPFPLAHSVSVCTESALVHTTPRHPWGRRCRVHVPWGGRHLHLGHGLLEPERSASCAAIRCTGSGPGASFAITCLPFRRLRQRSSASSSRPASESGSEATEPFQEWGAHPGRGLTRC